MQSTSVKMIGKIYRGIDIKLDHMDITGIDMHQDSKSFCAFIFCAIFLRESFNSSSFTGFRI